jgi:hypothetical protein
MSPLSLWNGNTYGSLSKVAFAITGARWNGRRPGNAKCLFLKTETSRSDPSC